MCRATKYRFLMLATNIVEFQFNFSRDICTGLIHPLTNVHTVVGILLARWPLVSFLVARGYDGLVVVPHLNANIIDLRLWW